MVVYLCGEMDSLEVKMTNIMNIMDQWIAD